jgi:hypothetical protein
MWPPVDLVHLPHWIVMVAPRSPRLLEAVDVASGLVASAPATELFRIDFQLRRVDAWDNSGWSGWRAKDLPGLVEATGDPLAVAGLMSMHRDGWLREASVRLLAEQHNGAEVRWLLPRCVDWVPQVRALAQDAVRARLVNPSGTYIDPLIRDAPLLLSQRFKALQGDTSLPVDIETGLRSSDALVALRAASRGTDRATRRAVVEFLVGIEPPLALLRGQLEDGDVVAVARAAKAALSGEEAEAAARLLLTGSFASLRALSLWTLLRANPTEASLVEQGLGDSSQQVRDVAQRHAATTGTDPLTWYRDRLSDEPLIALRGLGDIGRQQDAEDAVQYLGSAQASVRGAAARVIGRKGGSSHTATLEDLVLGSRGESAREATRGLIRRGITGALAEDLATKAIAAHADRPTATRRVYLQLLPRADRWVALRLGLLACNHPDPSVAELGLHLVSVTWSNWNRSATEPRDQAASIRELLKAAAPVPRADNRVLVDELDFLLLRTTGE